MDTSYGTHLLVDLVLTVEIPRREVMVAVGGIHVLKIIYRPQILLADDADTQLTIGCCSSCFSFLCDGSCTSSHACEWT